MPRNSSNTAAQLVSSYCPIGYCNIVSQSMALPNSTDWKEVDKFVCGNRTGRLCARCRGTTPPTTTSISFSVTATRVVVLAGFC